MILKQQFIISSLILLISITGCKEKQQNQNQFIDISSDMYVLTKKGLILRSEPSSSSEKIALLPYRSKMKTFQKTLNDETISNRTDRWYSVEWSGKKGWVFGGFIDDEDPVKYFISKDSLGPAKLGMSFDEFLSFFKYDKIENDDQGVVSLYKDERLILAFSDKSYGTLKIVNWLIIYNSKFETKSGLYPGMSFDELLSIYPKFTIKVNENSGIFFSPEDMKSLVSDVKKQTVFLLELALDDNSIKIKDSLVVDKSTGLKGKVKRIEIYYYN